MGITDLFRRTPPATTTTVASTAPAAPAATSPTTSGPNLDHLRKSNPKIDALIAEKPGLGKLLAKNSVSSGPREGEARTEIAWSFWTHSEKTNKKYGHGMTDKQITTDYIIAFQPSADANARVNLGRYQQAGQEIIGVYKVGDHVPRLGTAYDGGHLGEFDLVAHGKKGEQAVVGWVIVTVGDDGNVKGGGYPTMRNGQMVPYQDQKGSESAGGEYWGRSARITHGRNDNYVPITEN